MQGINIGNMMKQKSPIDITKMVKLCKNGIIKRLYNLLPSNLEVHSV